MQAQETNSWQAFELATDALRDIDAFAVIRPPDQNLLFSAREKLAAAVAEDPQFMRARYYGAIVDDMLGDPQEAAASLEDLLERQPPFRQEAEYNLAVSYYHLYGADNIEKAIHRFENVERGAKESGLRLLAQAGLTRCFAMKVLFSGRAGEIAEADLNYGQAMSESQSVLTGLNRQRSPLEKNSAREIEWRVLNGRGVARMFRSDYLMDRKEKEAELRKAIEDFADADLKSPDNWEIVCNLGSANLRLGYIANDGGSQSDRYFSEAYRYLTDVVDRIRPSYGFAFYELGRLARIRTRPEEAAEWVLKSMEIPAARRNVSDRTLARELQRITAGDTTFP